MRIRESEIANIPDSCFKNIYTLREALHLKWAGCGFSDETLVRMIQDRKDKLNRGAE